jgi:hypothetical protein
MMISRLSRSAFLVALTLAGGTHGAAGQSALSPEDHVEIRMLYAAYNHAIDLGDPEAWANTFVPDGTFLSSRGRAELVQFASDWFERYEGGSRHWNSQHLFVPTATGARGSAYLHLWDVRTTPPSTVLTGVYEDELVRTPDGWRFQARVLRIDRATSPEAPARDQP